MKKVFFVAIVLIIFMISCQQKEEVIFLQNEAKTIDVEFWLSHKGEPMYKIFHKDSLVLEESFLGLIREDGDFSRNLQLVQITKGKEIEDTYTMFHGKQHVISYEAVEYTIQLVNSHSQQMNIIMRLSDDGVAFQYYFPETSEEFKKIIDERTTYNFPENTKSWLQPMSKAKTGWSETNPSYEEHYIMGVPDSTKSVIGEGWVYPALFKSGNSWVLISETGLGRDYCGTRLKYDDELAALKVTFPQTEEVFPQGALNPEALLPWRTPWRILAIGSLASISESTLGTDLADPAIEMETDYIQSGLASWSWALLKDDSVNFSTTMEFIEYASDMNWPYCLIDVNWDTTIGDEKLKQLADYAASKNVKLIVWYNSSGSWNSTPYHPKNKLLTHQDRIREFKRMQTLGISGVKIDFFGGDGQSMIAYYHDILKDAADFQLLVNFHGATLPRGWQRTYPHLMTMESIKGEEFITFEQANADKAPSHCALLPFTRNVFDPMDFTPMVLDSIPGIQKRTSDAFDLALPVLFLSGIQHIAETPQGMAKQPAYVVDYLKDIPTQWDESKFIDGYPGEYVMIARRKGDTWHVVGINGSENFKELYLDLSFIEGNEGYLILDGEEGFKKKEINTTDKVLIPLKPHGGFVIKI